VREKQRKTRSAKKTLRNGQGKERSEKTSAAQGKKRRQRVKKKTWKALRNDGGIRGIKLSGRDRQGIDASGGPGKGKQKARR